MKILIDTHIAIWAVLNDSKLPERAKELIPYYDEPFIISV